MGFLKEILASLMVDASPEDRSRTYRLFFRVVVAVHIAWACGLLAPLDGPPGNGSAVKLGAAVVGRFVLAGNTVGWTHTPGGITSFEVIELEEDRT